MSQPAPNRSRSSLLEAVVHVRELLDALGDSLVAWRLPAIESIEAQLKDAIAALQIDALPPLEVSTRRSLITELANVANALSRCQRLGASFAELIQFQTYALGGTESYDAVGQKRTSGSASMLRVRA